MEIYGNLINRICENIKSKSPETGDGVTEYLYSDSHAYTVIGIKNPKRVLIQRDKAIRTDSSGMTDAQSYRYEADPTGESFYIRQNIRGLWKREHDSRGNTFVIGIRSENYDYGF